MKLYKILNKAPMLILSVMAMNIFAQDMHIGDTAGNITSVIDSITDLILAAVTIAGVASFFAALMKLYQHRKNPQQVPISQFFVMLIMSLALMGLPLIMLYGDTAYKIMKDL